MIENNHHDQPDEDFAEILHRLSLLANAFDGRRYPGRAWPRVGRRRPRWSIGRMAGWLAMVAATVLAIHFGLSLMSGESRPRVPQQPAERPLAAAPAERLGASSGDAPGAAAFPGLLIVEDLDSYSIVDLSPAGPVVSFARKDADSPPGMVSVPAEPQTAAATKKI